MIMKTAYHIVFYLFMVIGIACLFQGCGTIHAITHTPMFKVPSDNPPAPTKPDTKGALQATVDRQVHIMWFVSIALGTACGLCVWMQNYFMAIKFGLAALALPMIATLWSLYWAWVVAGILVAIGVISYLHYRVVLKPYVTAAETSLKNHIKR